VAPLHRRRRTLLTILVLALATTLLACAPALASGIAPQAGGSPNADRIHGLYIIVLIVAVVVFLGVEGALLYSVIRFRARRGSPRVADQIHGNTRLEIGWTIGAALIVLVITVVTFAKLSGIQNPDRTGPDGLLASSPVLVASTNQPTPPGGKYLDIKVNGQQFIWRFTYPNGAYSYETMVVPIDTTVVLDVYSQDVVHAWWVPQLGGQVDATPGYTNHTWFKIPKVGRYHGQCAELCGRHHANMVADVVAVTPADYQAWVNNQKQIIQQANQWAAQERPRLEPITTH
jgi:cytochrome c oxidase subunit 2